MTETLSKMSENRDENRKLLKQKKSLIIKQISAAKSKVHEFLTSFEAESKGKTDSQDLWLSERQVLQHTTSC
jgi:hypothetical protein